MLRPVYASRRIRGQLYSGSMTPFSFALEATDGRARAGRLETPHGTVETPAFMPGGTAGAGKAGRGRDRRGGGGQILLANTHHLMLRPGDVQGAGAGGLHRVARWRVP